MNGFFLINKPKDWTSRDVCNKISSLIKEKKIGHTGTLDPFATGLLIVSVNKGTKAGAFLDNIHKEYVAELELGTQTSTGDLTGEVIKKEIVPLINENEIVRVLNSFLGQTMQTPPMVSALHHQGQKLYELARMGIEVERKERPIVIDEIELLSFKDNIIKFRAIVSKGTYIRSLGEDIARKLNTVGHLKSLCRTKIGPFGLEQALEILEVKEDNIISIFDILRNFLPVYVLNSFEYNDVMNGRYLKINANYDKVLLVDQQQNVLAVYQKTDNGQYKSLRGLF